jgi:hypothetical protein
VSGRLDWEKAQWAAKNQRARQEPVADTLGTREVCWCGEPYAHDWPGQEEGAPHPKKEQ